MQALAFPAHQLSSGFSNKEDPAEVCILPFTSDDAVPAYEFRELAGNIEVVV